MKIKVKYNPFFPTHKKEAEVDTDDYGDSQLLEMLGASPNAGYVKDGSFVALAQEIIRRVEDDWYVLFQYLDVSVIKSADKAFKALFSRSPLTDAAADYVVLLLGSLEEGVEWILDLERATLALQLVGKSDTASTLRGKLKRFFQDQQKTLKIEQQQKEKDEILESGESFLQIGAYFGTELPIGTRTYLRQEFFELLLSAAKSLENMRVQSLDQMPPTLMLQALEVIKKDIKTSATFCVKSLGDTGRARIPTTFEETLEQDLQHRIRGLRQRVHMILEPVVVLIMDAFPGARLRYRGSLTDAVKNYTKSQSIAKLPEWSTIEFGNKAISINITAFDVDAFIELPDVLWDKWQRCGIIPDRKDQAIKGKIILEAWIPLLERLASQKNVAAYLELPKILYLRNLESILQAQLMLLDGYKQNTQEKRAEFEMVLQPQRKTQSAKLYGKPYKLGELSRGGSAYQELMSTTKSLKDEGIDEDGTWIEETHVQVTPRYTSVAKAQKVLVGRAGTRLRVIDLSTVKSISPVDTEALVQAIEEGYLPFLTDLHMSSTSLTKEQRKRIWDVLPVKIHLQDQSSLNF